MIIPKIRDIKPSESRRRLPGGPQISDEVSFHAQRLPSHTNVMRKSEDNYGRCYSKFVLGINVLKPTSSSSSSSLGPVRINVPARTAVLRLLCRSLQVTWCTNRFNIQQLHVLYLCVLYLSPKKQWLVLLISQTACYTRDEKCLLRGTNWVFKWRGLLLVFNP
jgi:hypothetical protein